MKEKRGILWGCCGTDMKEKELRYCCQLKEFLSAASERSLRRTGTQTGLRLAAREALAAALLAAWETYMWAYVWVCVFASLLPACSNPGFFFFCLQSNFGCTYCAIMGLYLKSLSVRFLCRRVGVSVYPCVFRRCIFVSVYPVTHTPRCERRRALGGLCHAAVCSFPRAWRPSLDK